MREIVVDGVKYVPKEDFGPIKIVVLERGFHYIGRVESDIDDNVTIRGARSLIRWGTSEHLGQLVNGPLPNTQLGASCTVQVREDKIVHMIEVTQDGWIKHID